MPSPLNCIRNSSIWPVVRDASSLSGGGHRLGGEAGVFTLDVEVAELPEVEDLLVEPGPVAHAAAVHVVGEVVDQLEAVPARMALHAVQELEVDVVDRLAVLEAVDQVERRAADALDRGQAQLHRTGGDLHRLRAQFERARIRPVRVLNAKRHGARRRPVLGREVRRRAARFVVDDEVDAALAVQRNVLGTVPRHPAKPQFLEHRLQHAALGRREFDELEPDQPHRVLEQIGHDGPPP
jgi:hypothetical protein